MHQKGFAPILIILVAVGVLALGAAGWFYVKKAQFTHEQPTPTSTQLNQTSSNPLGGTGSSTDRQLQPSSTPRVPSSAEANSLADTSTWQTFTDLEDFYSIQYPSLGTFFVQYSAVPQGTRLGWEGVGDFDITVGTYQPNGVRLQDWLLKNKDIDAVHAKAGEVATTTVNGMDCIIVFDSQVGRVSAYLEQDFNGFPFIHAIDFNSYTPEYTYPPFWNAMLYTFRGLPEQR
jgi:hypothetical protein